jgi:hypothetical protein
MSRRHIVPGAAAALVLAALVVVQPAGAAAPAPRGAACAIAGNATISPGLTQAAKTQKVTLSGVKLTNCHVGSAAAPGVPKTVTGTVTTSPNPVTSKASCASGNLALTATIRWSTGGTTTTSISTKGVTANQALQGKVTSSSDPNLKAGDLVAGDVAFKPTTTAQNCVKVPVTAVTFTGALGAGSPK